MANYRDLHDGSIALTGVVGVVLVFAAIVAIQVVFYWTWERFHQDRFVQAGVGERTDLYAQQQAALRQYRWVDPERGIVAIPVAAAQQRLVTQLSAGEGRFELPFLDPPLAPPLPERPLESPEPTDPPDPAALGLATPFESADAGAIDDHEQDEPFDATP